MTIIICIQFQISKIEVAYGGRDSSVDPSAPTICCPGFESHALQLQMHKIKARSRF